MQGAHAAAGRILPGLASAYVARRSQLCKHVKQFKSRGSNHPILRLVYCERIASITENVFLHDAASALQYQPVQLEQKLYS